MCSGTLQPIGKIFLAAQLPSPLADCLLFSVTHWFVASVVPPPLCSCRWR